MNRQTKIKNALVTGGAGFIGSHLVDALVAEGCRVRVIDNLSTGSPSNLEHLRDRISFYKGDIRDEDMLAKAASGCDVIFHQAAVVSVPQTVENPVESAMVNEIGTLNVLETARFNHVKRVVLASSCAVYGDDPIVPKREDAAPKPCSPYAVQKLTGEFYARLYDQIYGLDCVCLRYFNVYGPRQDPSSPYSGVISIFMTRSVDRQAPIIYGDGNQYRDFVFVKDVVTANLLAAKTAGARGTVCNIGTGEPTTINRLWKVISHMSAAEIEPRFRPFRPGDIVESVADVCYGQSVLGFKSQYALTEGLQMTLEWYQGHPVIDQGEPG